MRIFVLLFAAIWGVTECAYAQVPSVSAKKAAPQLSLTDTVKKINSGDEKTEDIAATPAETEADDKGIFSFMNFSFSKKEDTHKVYARPDEKKETFVQRITRQAEEGNVNAQLTLGYMYLYGEEGVDIDYDKAFRYYNMAAAQKDNVAINNLGSLYYSGIGTDKDFLKAATLFDEAAKLGNVEAAVNLAFIYLSGSNIGKNSQAAMELFKKAAEKGNPTAKFMLGYAYYKGFIYPQDYGKAVKFIREAANAEYAEAQYMMAVLYLNGHGITKNYGNAVKFLRLAVNQGNVDAMMELGDILALGTAYPKDVYRAHVLFNIAAVRGAPKAAEKRDAIEKVMKIEELLQAQAEAEKYVEQPSDLTSYVKQTFGNDVRKYVDENMKNMNFQRRR